MFTTAVRNLQRQFGLVVAVCGLSVLVNTARAEIELIGVGTIPGTATDRSGRTAKLSNGVPRNRLGGISALESTGDGRRYLALSDRGPADGGVDWHCRFHTLAIDIRPNRSPAVVVELLSTTMLTDSAGRPFTGRATAFSPTPQVAERLDPEGIRISSAGHIWISDEYGPQLIEFSRAGRKIRSIAAPKRWQIDHPAASKNTENNANRSGRQANRGMEGLAISRNGRVLIGLMQSPLLQDSVRKPNGKPTGTNCRLVRISRRTGERKEFLYVLDNADNKLNEILAVDAHRFLVIERDGEPGNKARFKKIVQINTDTATDIQTIPQLPAFRVPAGVVPVAKKMFIDLLDRRFALRGSEMPEKVEGLTFGPALPDGRRTLLIASDNDFKADEPTRIFVFAFGASDLPVACRAIAH